MPEHSQEPWTHVGGDGITRRSIILHGHTGACEEQHIAKDVAPEDADRIVACVNHLKLVPTSVLEKAAMMAEMFPCKPGDITPRYCEALILLMTGRRCKVALLDENEAMSMNEFLDGFIEYVRRNPWSSH